jgi:hypothetical protein
VVFLLVLLKPGEETPAITVPGGIQVIAVTAGGGDGVCELGLQLTPLLRPAIDASKAFYDRKVGPPRPEDPAHWSGT